MAAEAMASGDVTIAPPTSDAALAASEVVVVPVGGFLWVALVMAAALCGILLVRQVARRAWARHHDCRATAASRTKRPPRCKKRRKSVSRRSIQKVQPAESAASDD